MTETALTAWSSARGATLGTAALCPVARYGPDERDLLMADAGIVRNAAKIDATIGNAAALLAISAEHDSFAAYLASAFNTR